MNERFLCLVVMIVVVVVVVLEVHEINQEQSSKKSSFYLKFPNSWNTWSNCTLRTTNTQVPWHQGQGESWSQSCQRLWTSPRPVLSTAWWSYQPKIHLFYLRLREDHWPSLQSGRWAHWTPHHCRSSCRSSTGPQSSALGYQAHPWSAGWKTDIVGDL